MPLLSAYHSVVDWLTDNWRWLLVLSVLPLFGDNALYNIPLIIMALVGVGCVAVNRSNLWQRPEIRYLLAAFAALWLPQVIALIDAVEPGYSLRTVLHYPGYLFAALFVAAYLDQQDLRRLYYSILVILAIWIVDAILAWSDLQSRIGYSTSGIHTTSVLFSKLSLGHIMAVLLPLIFDYVRQRTKSPAAWLLLIGAVLIVMLSGRRVAWFMLIVAGTSYIVYLVWILRSVRPAKLAYSAVLFIVMAIGLYNFYQPFHGRVDTTLGLFSTNMETINKATAHRLDIWTSAARAGGDHWFNGIGPRGFRHVYADYAPADDFWANDPRGGPTHPHQLVLEIMAETGIIGICGYLVFWVVILHALRRWGSSLQWPYVLALAVAIFPLNAHMAFYGSYWSALVWWLTGIVFAVSGRQPGHQAAPPTAAVS